MAAITYKSPVHVLSDNDRAVNISNGGIFVEKDVTVHGSINSQAYELAHPGWYSLCLIENLAQQAIQVIVYSVQSNTYIDVTDAAVTFYSTGSGSLVADARMYEGMLYLDFRWPATIHVHTYGGDGVHVEMCVAAIPDRAIANDKTILHELRLGSPLFVDHSHHESIDCKRFTTDTAKFTTSQLGSPLSETNGERIQLYSPGFGIGMEHKSMWFSAENVQSGFKWYAGGQEQMNLLGDGRLLVRNGLEIGGGASSESIGGLQVSGPAGSVMGPHMCLSTDETPRFTVSAWDCNNVSVGFDTQFDGTRWVSTSNTSAFRIHKRQNELAFLCCGLGDEQWSNPFSIHKTGRVTCSSSLLAASVIPLTTRSTLGTANNPFASVHAAKILCKSVPDYSKMTQGEAIDRLERCNVNDMVNVIDVVGLMRSIILLDRASKL